MPKKDFKTATIQSIIRETETTKSFVLRPESPFLYQPGQFLTLIFPNKNPTDNLERRAFSFSSAPDIDPMPIITIKRIANGYASREMIDYAKVGDKLTFSHVAGNFTLPPTPSNYNHFMFFAAGSGITPVFSLLKSILTFHPKERITLVYSSNNLKDILFYQQLKQLEEAHDKRLHIEWLISQPENKKPNRLSHFQLLKLLKKHTLRHDIPATLFYLCGPFEYMDMIQIVLQTEGIANRQILKEHFYIPRLSHAPSPPDKTERAITLKLNGDVFCFNSKFPDNILSSAIKNDLPLNFSCRSGQCGSCVAKCIRGKIWMQYNEVLTDAEVKSGYVLTCCAFPIGGAVTLEK